MSSKWGKIAGIGAGIAVCSLALTPALAVVRSALAGDRDTAAVTGKVSLHILGSIGSFTPVTRDHRLANAYVMAARESQSRGFRFTPTSGSTSGERSLTVLVRAGIDELSAAPVKHSASGLNIAPVAYTLGHSKALSRFAAESSATTTAEQPPMVSVPPLSVPNFVLHRKPDRFSTNLQVEARDQTAVEPTSDAPQTLGSEKTYSVDVSSSFALTKNLNVQAGVRYRGPDNRLVPLTDQKQDSQAVYVGTKFKF